MGAREPHLTVPQLAERRGVAVKTVYRWNHTGTGPRYVRQGKRGRVAYPLAFVEAWERSHVRGGSPDRALEAALPPSDRGQQPGGRTASPGQLQG